MNRAAPPVYLDEIRVDGRARPAGPDLRLAAGDRAVTFLFGAPSFIAPERVQLRHQLVGHDPDWIASGSERQAHYAQLAPSRYALQVAARHSDGAWGPAETVQAFTVLPAWWQRGGARAAMAALAALPVLLLARYGSQRKLRRRLERLEQAHALDKERARIARDLHDELGAGLTQIGMLAHRLKRRSREPEIAPALGQLAAKTRRLAGELEGIVWTMSPKNDSLDRFAAYLVRFAHDFFQDSTIACVVRRPELIPPCGFAPDVQHHLLAVVKEALANALKYSGATQVTLTLGYSQGVFALGIVDNGAGFAAESGESDECNGLRNMRARIQEIGGRLQIDSAPRRGTSIQVQVRASPLPRPVASVPY
jgi:signal transduction histidine kinase